MTQWRSIKKATQRAGRDALVWHVAGTISAATGLDRTFQFPDKVKLVRAYAIVETAPTGAAMLIDIHVNGTTVVGSTKLTIADGATEGSFTAFATKVVTDTTHNVTLDVDQVGSSVAGADLTVVLEFEPLIR